MDPETIRSSGLYEELVKAVAKAFPTQPDLAILVSFKLKTNLNDITPPSQHLHMVMQVVDWAIARGRKLDDLVAGALNQNPDNLRLLAVAEKLELDEGAAKFEAYVLENSPTLDVEDFHTNMRASERAVCRVEGPKYGTGLLVGPGLVVTNYHVVDTAIEGKSSPQKIVLRFDYKKKANGTDVQKGTEYQLAGGSKWLAASSPMDKLDYALLRVVGSPEEGYVAGQPGAPTRGYLVPIPYSFQPGDPLYIIQHPEKDPQKYAVGFVQSTDLPNYVHYKVNTAGGSSGAPCFNAEWQPVALHHAGIESEKVNRGVAFSAILESWQQDEKLYKELGY